MKPIFVSPPPPCVPVLGGGCYPIGRIFCVGRNYAEHAREMGGDPSREPPFFFTKFAQSYVADGAIIPYPSVTRNFHHEVELVVAIGKAGFEIAPADAYQHIFGYAVGLDLTRRDLQQGERAKGQPWDIGKNFEHSAPVGTISPVAATGVLKAGAISLAVNGAPRQHGDIVDMTWPVPDIIDYLSRLYTLEPGDLIMTGTPAGVGPLNPGDQVEAEIAGLSPLRLSIAA